MGIKSTRTFISEFQHFSSNAQSVLLDKVSAIFIEKAQEKKLKRKAINKEEL